MFHTTLSEPSHDRSLLPFSATQEDELTATLLAFLLQAGTSSVEPGPRIGETLPAFALPDQDGRPRDFASLKGPNGLVLVFYRSADW